MKPILIATFFVLIFSSLQAQSDSVVKIVKLQRIKENRRIDSLLDIVIPQSDNKEKYFCFEISGSGNAFFASIFQIPASSSKILLPVGKPEDFTFFSWRGYTIFLIQVENPFHFFDLTDQWQTFKVGDIRLYKVPYPQRLQFSRVYYLYPDGRFELDNMIVR